MSRYAGVVLPLGVDKIFTYLIPPDLEESVRIGVRVIVPFGRKIATGIVAELPASTDLTKLKPVRDVIDRVPVLRPELLQLCRWVADYYMAPLGEVIKTSLPQGFSPASTRIVRLGQATVTTDERPSRTRARVLDLVASSGPISVRELGKRAGVRSIHSVLLGLEKVGHIEIEESLRRPRGHARLREFVRLDLVNGDSLRSVSESLQTRAAKARSLLETVSRLRSGGVRDIAVADLVRTSGASTSVFRKYRTSGLLPTEQRDVGFEQDLGTEEQTRSIVLNEMQKQVLDPIVGALDGEARGTFLLHGVTGSGKTQVYIEAIRRCLALGKGAIVLVPEISLTPQIVRRFNSHFPGSVAVVHSRLSPAERFDVWKRTASSEFRVLIGPRSAVFAPVHPLGLIVVDEEHEASYKQFDAIPRYNARDVALVRAHMSGAVAVLGSATPSLESYHNAKEGKYRLLELRERVDRIPMPEVSIIDMREERKKEYSALKERMKEKPAPRWKGFQQGSVSEALREKIRERLDRREGIILLQNRRGFAPFVECQDCGYAESCERCSVTLTYHLSRKHLRCHYCGTVYPPRDRCPQCAGDVLMLKGIGTQRVQEELTELFPGAVVLRMDLDTTTGKGAHDRILKQFGERRADILLGTQMVAKGLDFPHVTLVGVISADTQMLLPDFRSAERTFQLLTQVAGRAGRSTLKGEVVIQTHQPGHPALRLVLDHDFIAFFEDEKGGRQELGYPPFSRLVLIECRGKNDDQVRAEAERIGRALTPSNGLFTLLGPAPAVIHKLHDHYRWHLIVKGNRAVDPAGTAVRATIRAALPDIRSAKQQPVRTLVDVDPVGLL